MDEKTKLIALAHLKSGKKPKEVADLLDISYATALSLRKQLLQAEEQDTISELFDLEEAAIETLLENVKSNLAPALEVLEGEVEPLNEVTSSLSKGISKSLLLESELQESARILLKQLNALTVMVKTPDSALTLAEAIVKLQDSFFSKGTNVQVNNYGSGFEKYLKD